MDARSGVLDAKNGLVGPPPRGRRLPGAGELVEATVKFMALLFPPTAFFQVSSIAGPDDGLDMSATGMPPRVGNLLLDLSRPSLISSSHRAQVPLSCFPANPSWRRELRSGHNSPRPGAEGSLPAARQRTAPRHIGQSWERTMTLHFCFSLLFALPS